MANKKPKLRTEQVGVRMPPKLRYGLELVARKSGQTLSEAMLRALECYLEIDGIGLTPPRRHFSLLDTIWSESKSERFVLIADSYGLGATSEEIEIALTINDIKSELKRLNPDWKCQPKDFYAICDKHLEDIKKAAESGEVIALVDKIQKEEFGDI